MDLSHVNPLATGSCVQTALPAVTTPISFSLRCTRIIETIQVKVIGATVTIAIHILTTATSPKRNNVTCHVLRKTAAIWFAENVSHRRTTLKAYLRLIMEVEVGEEEEEDITKRKND